MFPNFVTDDYQTVPVLVGAVFGLIVAKIPWFSPKHGSTLLRITFDCTFLSDLSIVPLF